MSYLVFIGSCGLYQSQSIVINLTNNSCKEGVVSSSAFGGGVCRQRTP